MSTCAPFVYTLSIWCDGMVKFVEIFGRNNFGTVSVRRK